jgi:thiol-disulfide isomerase/thioredoxin
MKKILTFLALLVFLQSQAQDSIVIKGEFKNNTRYAKMVVTKFGVGSIPIAAVPIQEGKFSISAPMDIEPGIYRFQYSQTSNDFVDLIINGKEKEIEFSINLLLNENKSPQFTKSNENKIWYGYLGQSQKQLQKIELLNQFLGAYPSATDKIVLQGSQALALEKLNYDRQKNLFLNQNADSWAALLIKNRPYYFTNAKEDWRIQNFKKKQHFWDQINTTNPRLLNTPLYTELILEYLKYYMNPEMKFNEAEMNEGFKKSVDTIMTKFSGNKETEKFALKYLQLGFKEIDKEEVLQYIDQKYQALAVQCQYDTEKMAFENRMASYAAMKSGNQAPDILFENNTSLYDIKSEQSLILFWASWCPLCQEELPKVENWAKENPTTKVIAISLDENKTEYDLAIKQFPSLFHSTDLKKWNGKAVKDYFVYGTPTFILLDSQKKILKKASTFEMLIAK